MDATLADTALASRHAAAPNKAAGITDREWHRSAPFTSTQEAEDATLAALCGDDHARHRFRCARERRKRREQEMDEALHKINMRPLTAEHLRAMLKFDRENYVPIGAPGAPCEYWGCDDDEHDAACPWSHYCGEELELHGLALHRRDPTYWERLRKCGATPEIVAEANTILHPYQRREAKPVRPVAPACTIRRHRRATRPRERRSAPARRVQSRSAGGGSSGDPPSGEPADEHPGGRGDLGADHRRDLPQEVGVIA